MEDHERTIVRTIVYQPPRWDMKPAELRRIRLDNKLKQKDFAKALGLSGSNHYSRYERGDRPVPPMLARVADMVDRFGLPRRWLEDDK